MNYKYNKIYEEIEELARKHFYGYVTEISSEPHRLVSKDFIGYYTVHKGKDEVKLIIRGLYFYSDKETTVNFLITV